MLLIIMICDWDAEGNVDFIGYVHDGNINNMQWTFDVKTQFRWMQIAFTDYSSRYNV